MASPQLSPRNRLRVQSRVNDNQCVASVTGLKNSVYVSGQTGLNPSPVIAGDKNVTVTSHVDFCVANTHSVTGLPQKKGFTTGYFWYPDPTTSPGPEHLEHLSKHRIVQNGDHRDNKDLPTMGEVGHIHRLQSRILPYTNSQSVQEVHAFSHPGAVQSPTLRPVHSTHGVHSGGQRGQADGFTEGYKSPPVPRRLVGESHIPPNVSPAYTDFGSSVEN